MPRKPLGVYFVSPMGHHGDSVFPYETDLKTARDFVLNQGGIVSTKKVETPADTQFRLGIGLALIACLIGLLLLLGP